MPIILAMTDKRSMGVLEAIFCLSVRLYEDPVVILQQAI